MKSVVSTIALAIVLAISSCTTAAAVEGFDYDVDTPPSKDKTVNIVRITINKCETNFKVKKADWDKFEGNDEAMKDLVKKAIERAGSGCN